MRARGHDSVRDWLRAVRWSRRRIVRYEGVRIDRRLPHVTRAVDASLFSGIYERPEVDATRTLVEPTDRVLEIGAGLGVVTTLAAKVADRVTSCEANPHLQPALERTFALNKVSVDLRMQAVATAPGRVRIAIGEVFWTSRLGDEGVEVEAVPFSALLEEVHPTFVILDGEGIERELLAEPLPAHVGKLVVELHPHVIGEAGCASLVAHLAAQGFVPADCSSEANVFVGRRETAAAG